MASERMERLGHQHAVQGDLVLVPQSAVGMPGAHEGGGDGGGGDDGGGQLDEAPSLDPSLDPSLTTADSPDLDVRLSFVSLSLSTFALFLSTSHFSLFSLARPCRASCLRLSLPRTSPSLTHSLKHARTHTNQLLSEV